jgi:NAD(P)-dependent dehydrogenase (short-subunit alcohol dehydrogenase family)
VTIASSAGLVPLRSAVSYTTSKHAAVGFHDSVRQELRTQAPGVRMTLVTPFFVNTGMFTGTESRLAVWPDNRQESPNRTVANSCASIWAAVMQHPGIGHPDVRESLPWPNRVDEAFAAQQRSVGQTLLAHPHNRPFPDVQPVACLTW